MKLIIVHYHLRPGGVRRIIELAVPHLTQLFREKIDTVWLACGEATDREWNTSFRDQLPGVSFRLFVQPPFRYFSEQKTPVRIIEKRIRAGVHRLLSGADADHAVVWAHNLGLARNLILARELARACQERGVPLVSHHHDWWFDNRWRRWPEMRAAGFRTLGAAARAVFPPASVVRHVSINQRDARLLTFFFGKRAHWIPNLTERSASPAESRIRRARVWLRENLGDDGPIWILPCRLLRRKNIAEALLLTRWLRPEGWLVTTAGVSSADEQAYADKLAAAARQDGWRLRLSILQGEAVGKPRVVDLLAASEAVLLTSIQEGFGLPNLEAAAAGRPLIARDVPNVAPDLKRFGFRSPQSYADILISPELFDWTFERKRQTLLFDEWKRRLPKGCRKWLGAPFLLANDETPRALPFSRLTLTAQLEVLRQPIARSWEVCSALNPFLLVWKERAATGHLKITEWPRRADRWLSGAAYAQRFASLLEPTPPHPSKPAMATAAQETFIRKSLGPENLFPLLWACDT